jgi:ClpP class serine protease
METADLVRAVATRKPVKAFVNGTAASAAYAIAAGAREIIVAPSAVVGSIGVVCLHLDRSAAYAKKGVKPTLIHAGAYKVDGNSLQPLEDGPRARIQQSIDDFYSLFVTTVGKLRPGLGAAGARRTEAGLFMGEKAIAAGLADRVGTMDDAVASFRRPEAAAPQASMPATPRPGAPAQPQRPAAAQLAAASPPAQTRESLAGVVAAADGALCARALADARRSGISEAQTAGFVSAYCEAALAERARIRAIFTCPQAKGREASARHLALETTLSAVDALAALTGLPTAVDSARGARMRLVPRPAVRPSPATELPDEAQRQAAVEAGWAGVAAKLNARLPPDAVPKPAASRSDGQSPNRPQPLGET